MPLPSPIYQYSVLTAAEQIRLAADVVSAGTLATFDAGHLPELERAVAAQVGRSGAVAVNSGSAALALAVRGLGIGPGQEVIIPEVGWVSIGTAVADCGATMRVAPVTETLTPGWNQIEPLINPATAAVILAHLRGRAAPGTRQVAARLAERGIPLIEDCAQAWGVTADTRPAGAWGTAAAFSAQTYKMIAVGEGGFLLADDPGLLGLTRALAGDTRQATPAPAWRGNHRMNEVSAALARPQLAYLDTLTAALRRLQHRAVSTLTPLAGLRIVLPAPQDIPAGNGSLVGLWLETPGQARRLADAYQQAGLRSWWPGPGDLHTAAAWPVQPDHRVTDVRCYLDLQIPWLPDDQHPNFAAAVTAVTADALAERAP
jgi:dTDP-4-amino-4,6-dideoxygalactose transaminase